jgi:hypothetical protein
VSGTWPVSWYCAKPPPPRGSSCTMKSGRFHRQAFLHLEPVQDSRRAAGVNLLRRSGFPGSRNAGLPRRSSLLGGFSRRRRRFLFAGSPKTLRGEFSAGAGRCVPGGDRRGAGAGPDGGWQGTWTTDQVRAAVGGRAHAWVGEQPRAGWSVMQVRGNQADHRPTPRQRTKLHPRKRPESRTTAR